MSKRIKILLAVLIGSVVTAWIVAFAVDSESLGIGVAEPLAPDGPPLPPDYSESAGVALDKVVPDCTLHDLNGSAAPPNALRNPIPTVIEFGSFTCKYCTSQIGMMDGLAAKYRGKVKFLLVYGNEAHPGIAYLPGGYEGDRKSFTLTPTKADRLAAAKILRDTLAVQRDILIEDVESENMRERCYLRAWMYHPGLVVDPNGRVVYAAKWLKAESVDQFLAKYLASDGKCEPVCDDSPP